MPGPDLSLLADVIGQAGQIAMRYFKRNPQAWDKGADHGPVTEADLAVNDFLKTRLMSARPDYGWLSEETPDDPARLSHETVFIVDPIDGTRAFIAGEDNFAISIAIARQNRAVAGAVLLPAKGRLYMAEQGGPALLDGAAIRASTRSELSGAEILATRANMTPDQWPGGLPDLQRSFRTSLAYRLCLVAQGRFDGMLTFRQTWEWDIAAGALICQCAGAAVTDRRGNPLEFNSIPARTNGVIACAPDLSGQILSRL